MHPNIKKFWEDAGYEVICLRPAIEDDYTFWTAMKDGKQSFYVARISNNDLVADSYRLPDEISCNIFSEEEMLRIIKLKAFL